MDVHAHVDYYAYIENLLYSALLSSRDGHVYAEMRMAAAVLHAP